MTYDSRKQVHYPGFPHPELGPINCELGRKMQTQAERREREKRSMRPVRNTNMARGGTNGYTRATMMNPLTEHSLPHATQLQYQMVVQNQMVQAEQTRQQATSAGTSIPHAPPAARRSPPRVSS